MHRFVPSVLLLLLPVVPAFAQPPSGKGLGVDSIFEEALPLDAPAAPGPQLSPGDLGLSEQATLQQYLATGNAPVLHRNQERVIPYGVEPASLTCPLLGVCVVDLEPGEIVQDIALADPRWHIGPTRSGPAEAPTEHLIVKPTAPGLSTNAFVTTNRRTYDLNLRSPSTAEAADPDLRIDRRISFYYPQDLVRRVRTAEAADAAAARRRADAQVAPLGTTDLSALHFAYEIKRWDGNPVQVFDDGRQTFIELKRRHGLNDAPALLAVTKDGTPAILNYRLSKDGRFYVVDSLLYEARLLYRVGKKTHIATIKRLEDR